jgi:UDP-N-acetylglucosamine--N-acetylmuramyl-(pentapeptide) pyrophosphoryl-undecaprenol N-acetylglucosamine transferase
LIFATLGTHHQPFERFVRTALTLAAGRELVIQHGYTPRVPSGPSVRWHQWLAPDEVDALTREAAIVITHAGVASIVDAVRAGHRPIVIARRKHFDEHVDDHQLQIVSALAGLGVVTPLYNGIDLSRDPLAGMTRRAAWPPPGLKASVRHAVLGA